MERALQGILLDLDETLYSREEAFWGWLDVEARTAANPGRLDLRKVADLDQHGRGDKRALLEYLDSSLEWRQAHEARLERFRSGISAMVQLAPGVRESLTRIAGQWKLGLVSNGTSATQRAKLRALALDTLFDPVVISEEVGFRKPEVRIFELAIANWRVPASSVLFVGDDPISDIAGARSAGMRALQVGHADGIPSILSLEAWLDEHAEEALGLVNVR
jgi:putative hydrolase of the HAD superfamily